MRTVARNVARALLWIVTGMLPFVIAACYGAMYSFSRNGRGIDAAVRDDPYFCRAGINIASVLTDGSIGACPNISRSLAQGNVRVDDFQAVWEERFEPFRDRTWMRKGPCIGCREWRRCLGNSLHLWDDEAGRTAYCSFAMARGDA